MANAAAKKAAKAGDMTSKKYLPYIFFSSGLYIGVRLIWGYQNTTLWHFLYLIIFSIIHLICQYGLIQSAKDNLKGEMYFDAFCVNLLSQVVSAFTNWGRSILLLIPAYFVYLGISWYLSTRKNTPPPIVPAESQESSSSQNSNNNDKRGRIKIVSRR